MAKSTEDLNAPAAQVRAMQENLSRAVLLTRGEEGWSRRYLAEVSGLSERFIADVERGVANPSLSSLAALAKALALDVPGMLSSAPELNPRLGQVLSHVSRLEQEELIRRFEARPRGGRDRRVALIGLRGAGKTTVGKLLAKQLGRDMVELDQRVEDVAQLPLAQIFELHGDVYYRKLEKEALREVLLPGAPLVIVTGGGIVTRADTYGDLRDNAQTVWLKTTPEEYLARVLRQGDHRPMERRPQALAELKSLLAAREQAYRQADLTVDTTGITPDEVTRRIVTWLGRASKTSRVAR